MTKKIERIKKPFAARVCGILSVSKPLSLGLRLQSYNNPVIPSEYAELIQARDKIPARSDVSSKEDAECEDGDRVHEVALSCSRRAIVWRSSWE